MTYEARTIKKVIAMKDKAIYDESATVIEIDDDAAGEYIAIRQDDGKIKIDGDEWPVLRAAIDELVADLRDEDGKKQAKTDSVAEMFRNCRPSYDDCKSQLMAEPSIFRDDAEIDAKKVECNWLTSMSDELFFGCSAI